MTASALHALLGVHIRELEPEGDVGGVQIGHLLVDAEGLLRFLVDGVVIGDDLVAFEGVAGQALFGVEVGKRKVGFDLFGIDIEDFFIESDRLGGESVGGQDIGGFLIGVDCLGLRVLLKAQVADRIENVGIVRRFLGDLLPLGNRLVELALWRRTSALHLMTAFLSIAIKNKIPQRCYKVST